MLATAKRRIQLRGKAAFLNGFLLFQLRDRRVHCVDLLIQLGKGILGFTQFTRGGGDGLFLRFELCEQTGTLLLLLAYGALFGGDIRTDGFELIAVIRMGGKRRTTIRQRSTRWRKS